MGGSDKPEEERSLARWQAQEALRRAELGFIVDRQRRPLEHWWAVEGDPHVSLAEFVRRANLGRWVEQRDRYWASVKQETLRQTRLQVVKSSVAELSEIQRLRSDVVDLLRPVIRAGKKIYPVKPNSMEGLISAFVKLDQLVDAKRDIVMSQIGPELDPEETTKKHSFEPEEMRLLARMLLERRRAALAANSIEVDSDPGGSEGSDRDGNDGRREENG